MNLITYLRENHSLFYYQWTVRKSLDFGVVEDKQFLPLKHNFTIRQMILSAENNLFFTKGPKSLILTNDEYLDGKVVLFKETIYIVHLKRISFYKGFRYCFQLEKI